MKLIAQRLFHHDGATYQPGQAVEVSEATGKELLAVGTLVLSPEDYVAAVKARQEEKGPNINGYVQLVDGGEKEGESVNSLSDPAHRQTKPAKHSPKSK